MTVAADWPQLALLAAVLAVSGAGVGLLAGLFGVGGGAIVVPVLYEVFGSLGLSPELAMPLSVGTSLAVIVPTSIRSFTTHRAKGAADTALLKAWAIPIVGGVLAGSWIAHFAPAAVFKAVFVFVAYVNAVKLTFVSDRWHLADDVPGEPWRGIIGFVIGILSALMGIGGGNLCNFVMTLCKRPIHQAIGTASGLGVLISIPGAIGFMLAGLDRSAALPPFSIGFVSLIGAALIFPASFLTAPIGANLAHKLSRRTLELAFSVFLVAMGTRFLISLLS